MELIEKKKLARIVKEVLQVNYHMNPVSHEFYNSIDYEFSAHK